MSNLSPLPSLTPEDKVQWYFPWDYTYHLKYKLTRKKSWQDIYDECQLYIPKEKKQLRLNIAARQFPDVKQLSFEDYRLFMNHHRDLVCLSSMMKSRLMAMGKLEAAAQHQQFLDQIYELIIVPHYGSHYDATQQTLIHWAAATGQTDKLVALCKAAEPSKANPCDAHGTSPLHLACRNGHVESVEILLQCGADPNQPASMKYSCYAGHSESKSRGETPLHLATEGGHLPVVQRLMEIKGLQVDALDGPADLPIAMTAWQIADLIGETDIAELLSGKGAKEEPSTYEPKFEHKTATTPATSPVTYPDPTSYMKPNPYCQDKEPVIPLVKPGSTRNRAEKFLNFLDQFIERECKHHVGRSRQKYQLLLNVMVSLKKAHADGEFDDSDPEIRHTLVIQECYQLSEAEQTLLPGRDWISLIDALKMHRLKANEKKENKTPDSAVKLLQIVDPSEMKKHMLDYLESCVKKLNKMWRYAEKEHDIFVIQQYIDGIKALEFPTLEKLMLFKLSGCQKNLLMTLRSVGRPNGTAPFFEGCCKWFELRSVMELKENTLQNSMESTAESSIPLTDFN